MNYSQTLDYLYTKLPLFSRIGPAALKKDLHNTEALCASLSHPENAFKSIHVGGTNGKGSVSHMLAAVLQTAGYKTGLYTSPHLYDFRERIRINGAMISEAEVVQFVAGIQPQIEALEPSFFEVTVAMAFQFFAKEKVDVAIIEVGLGGRLDSTNVIMPELSVITNIGMDHMAILGNTLQEIAGEKAGIIKKEIPVVIGERNEETDAVFEKKAASLNAAIFFAQDYSSIKNYQLLPDYLTVSIEEKNGADTFGLKLDLPGIYQLKNVQTAILSLRLLQQSGWKIGDRHIAEGLQKVKALTGLMGRWEVLRQRPLLILDVAHNADGIRQMLQHLQQQHFKGLHLVLGTVKDKDIDAVLGLMPKDAVYYFTQAHIPRALPAEGLQEKAAGYKLYGNSFQNVNNAIEAALQQASENDLILVCGSIFLVAEVDRQKWKA